ncbi:carboxymuconolactone decarboxylase family protein, partial [Streptomyces sp. NPDC056626]|uniref:carboxymuconolactone decarboxylase family protein n=1 Tax=Streptomyces sp. NPDC056626 TaxID=3345880 RepID=UPI0036B51D12
FSAAPVQPAMAPPQAVVPIAEIAPPVVPPQTPAQGRPDPYDAGIKVRREVLGDAHVDRALASADAFSGDFQEFITRYAWGEIWSRPGLDRRMRSSVTLTALVAGVLRSPGAPRTTSATPGGGSVRPGGAWASVPSDAPADR